MDLAVEAKISKPTRITSAITRLGDEDIAVLTILALLFQAFEKSIGIGALINSCAFHKSRVRGRKRTIR
jgi:hypothetical protein